MKNINKGIIILLTAFLLSGCVKSHMVTTIKNDKSMTFSVDYLMSDKLIKMGVDINDSVNKEEVEKMGFKYEEITDNNYSGVKITKDYKNIDDVSNENGKKVNLGDIFSGKDEDGDKVLFKVEKSFFKNKYTATFTYDSKTDNVSTGDNESDENDESILEKNDTLTEDDNKTDENTTTIGDLSDMSTIMALATEMELSYELNLPCKSLSNDATNKSEDGKKLTWKLATDSVGEINYSFELLNVTNVIIVCGVGLLIIIVAVIIILKKIKSKKAFLPAEGLIHTDFDPSIADKVNETSEPVQEISNNTEAEIKNELDTPNIENSLDEPKIEMPTEQPTNLEITLSEEKTADEVKQENEENPVLKQPTFITSEVADVQNIEVAPVQEIELDTPDIIDMDNKNN